MNDRVMQRLENRTIGVLTEGTRTRDARTGSSLGLSKFQILADFGQNLALCIAVFELMHEKKRLSPELVHRTLLLVTRAPK